MNELRVLDLFSGIGGFSLGLKRAGGFRTVAYCEIEPYCQAVLAARMADGSLDVAPICSDITKLDGKPWRGRVDLICGGFPCQDISNAGNRVGIGGERSGLWSELHRLICEIRPRIVFVENVAALLARGMERVLGDLAESGYDAEWDVIPACAVGAPHIRERVWIVAYPMSSGERWLARESEATKDASNAAGNLRGARRHDGPKASDGRHPLLAHPFIFGRRRKLWEREPEVARCSWWDAEPNVGRVAHGVPSGVDRRTALGNAVVPQVVEWIGRRIMNRTELLTNE